MQRLEAIALALPEATRVDIEAWDGEPTGLSVKLPEHEAAAVVADRPR